MLLIQDQVSNESLIPDVLRAWPQARTVLDKYGLRGCGGQLGPVETLSFFARAHDVPLPQLLSELRIAAASSESIPSPPSKGDRIYRPFFKAGIAVVLTLGAAWGAILLIRIGIMGSFRAVTLHEVNAHGHAQIFGWVGLFVMGFAYQAFPRFKHTSLSFPHLAYSSLWLMLVGLILRSIYEPLAASLNLPLWPAVVASAMEVIAISLFAGLIVETWRVSGKALTYYDAYIACALFWFVVQAIYDGVYLFATLTTTGPALLSLVATWQAPLRDIQIHGFALFMTLGVSQRLFHHFYGFNEPNRRLSAIALITLNFALIGEVGGLVLSRLAGHSWIALWYASVLLLSASVAFLVWDWKIYSQPQESDRSLKFLRAAYIWLLVSLGMMVLLPVYQFGILGLAAPSSEAAQVGFSHAYYGAIRHAITVGFISLMIVGVASKVVPTLNGVDTHSQSALWMPYVLINLGCAIRVVFQALTDLASFSFPIAGASGVLEVTGLAIWGIHLWQIMRRGAVLEEPRLTAESLLGPLDPISKNAYVAEVLEQHPYMLNTFLSFGFRPLSNPWLRKTLARGITLERACRLLDVNLEEFLNALNQERIRHTPNRASLAVIENPSESHWGKPDLAVPIN